MLLLDVSGSMAEADVPNGGGTSSRLESAKLALHALVTNSDASLPRRADDLIGIITFAARVEDVCPPTLEHRTVLRFLKDAQPIRTLVDNTTNVGDAIAVGLDLLKRTTPPSKAILLVSDGEHNVPEDVAPRALKPRQAAQLARALGIKLYAIYLHGADSDSRGKQAVEMLRDAAEITGGQAYSATDAASLERIQSELDRKLRVPVLSHEYYRYQEIYPWCALCALFGLLFIALGEAWWMRRTP